MEDAQRLHRHFVGSVSAENVKTLFGGVSGDFGEQPGFSASRLAFQEDQSAASVPHLAELHVEPFHFVFAGDEGGFGQGAAAIVRSDDHRRIRFALFQSADDGLDIGQHRLRRLIPIAGVLVQKPLQNLIDARGIATPIDRKSGTRAVMCSNRIVPTLLELKGG